MVFNMVNVDNKNFLKYLKEKSNMNLNFINLIKFNKNSISIKVNDKQYVNNFVFNDLFNKKSLLNLIIKMLHNYMYFNNIECSDIDYLTYRFKKLNIN